MLLCFWDCNLHSDLRGLYGLKIATVSLHASCFFVVFCTFNYTAKLSNQNNQDFTENFIWEAWISIHTFSWRNLRRSKMLQPLTVMSRLLRFPSPPTSSRSAETLEMYVGQTSRSLKRSDTRASYQCEQHCLFQSKDSLLGLWCHPQFTKGTALAQIGDPQIWEIIEAEKIARP